jgi:predicted O-methyltransferase YrrM
MSIGGTAAYRDRTDLPDLVARAAEGSVDFEYSCQPDQGRLLALLAAGTTGVIGETGTGCGVGLAWLASAAGPDTRLVSVERDPERHAIAQRLFAGDDRVTVLHGDYRDLAGHGPFDLLVLDGGGQGKGAEPPVEPERWLRLGGTVVIDDFTPLAGWPPEHDGQLDTARHHWLTHPALLATEIRLNPGLATVVARYVVRR